MYSSIDLVFFGTYCENFHKVLVGIGEGTLTFFHKPCDIIHKALYRLNPLASTSFARLCEKIHYTDGVCSVFRPTLVAAAILLLGNVFPLPVAASDNSGGLISIPAVPAFQLSLPGRSDHFLRPGKIFCDRGAAEVYVVDAGHNRVIVFDERGIYHFEFSLTGYCGTVTDLVVSHDGLIYILGTTSEGRRIFRFDFDGEYLGAVTFPESAELDPLSVSALGIDRQGRLYLQDQRGLRIIRLAANGDFDLSFAIAAQLDDQARLELAPGPLTVAGNEIFLPMATLGTVYRFSTDGQFLGTIGHPGTTTGGLAFPISVAVTADQMVVVLDKQRFNVQCYTMEDEFLGEFGGKGINPGWFYFPSYVAADSQGQIYVGQIFLNRVQACRLPEVIHDQFINTITPKADPPPASDGEELGGVSNRGLNKISITKQNRVGTGTAPASTSTFHNMMEVYNA